MTTEQSEAAIKYHRDQIAHANRMAMQGTWTHSQSANHRESHERLLREVQGS